QALVSGRQLGMVAAPGPASVREHEDALDVVHERCGFGEVCRAGAVLNLQPITLADNAARSAGDFGHDVGPKAMHDLVERAGHWGERSEFFDQPVAPGNGVPAFDRLAISIDRPG